MTTGSGLGDKPPPCDSNKDGGSLIGERWCRLPPKLCFTFHLISKLQVRGWLGISEQSLWNTNPTLTWNANPPLAVNCCCSFQQQSAHTPPPQPPKGRSPFKAKLIEAFVHPGYQTHC